MIVIRSKAPLRISFCGGGTDLEHYYNVNGGVVLNATINKFAYGSFFERQDDAKKIFSYDYKILIELNKKDPLSLNGEMDLVKSIIKNFEVSGRNFWGFEMYLNSDAPPGSGLGSSSTMAVALVGLLKNYFSIPITEYEVAELAYKIERKDLKIVGGKQDQYAASFGGFNLIEFYKDKVIVNPLRISRNTINELEYNLILCYTGKTRLSSNIVQKQIDYYNDNRTDTVTSMKEMKDLTIEMKNALLVGKLDDFAEMLHIAGEQKKRMNPLATNSFIDELYDEARKSGVIGGKVLGAGGGGYLLLYCPIQKRASVTEKLEKLGGNVISFCFESHGMQTWNA